MTIYAHFKGQRYDASQFSRVRVLVAGAGRFGRELVNWMHGGWREEGLGRDTIAFIDDTDADPRSQNGQFYPPKVGKIVDFEPDIERDAFICSIGETRDKMHVSQKLLGKGMMVASFIDHQARIPATAHWGRGAIFSPFSLMSANAFIDEFVTVNVHSSIGHDVELGPYCTLSSHVDICGRVKVGEGVFFGSGSRVLPRVKIGAWATIAAGAVVVRDVPPGCTVAGNPARIIKEP